MTPSLFYLTGNAQMDLEEMQQIISLCHVPDFTFVVSMKEQPLSDSTEPVYYLQGRYMEQDVVTGDPEDQHTRKWLLSRHMVKSEIVQTAFKCYLGSLEHRAREHFTYRGRRVLGPHFDVDALWEICKDKYLDYRRD